MAGDRLLSAGLRSDIIDTRCLITVLCVTSEFPQAEAAVSLLWVVRGGNPLSDVLYKPLSNIVGILNMKQLVEERRMFLHWDYHAVSFMSHVRFQMLTLVKTRIIACLFMACCLDWCYRRFERYVASIFKWRLICYAPPEFYSVLKMVEMCFSETPRTTYKTTQRHKLENTVNIIWAYVRPV